MIALDTLLPFVLAAVLLAARAARWLAKRPLWATAQRWIMGATFAAIAPPLALDERR